MPCVCTCILPYFYVFSIRTFLKEALKQHVRASLLLLTVKTCRARLRRTRKCCGVGQELAVGAQE
jgi:hypothetical protein